MKKILTILLIMIALVSQSQDITGWRKHLEDQVLAQSKKENNALKINDPKDIIAVPIYYYTCPGADIIENKKTCVPIIDSFVAYAVLMNKDLVRGIAQNTGKKKFGFYTVTELQRLKRKEAEDTTYQMIRLARTISPNYFFVYFFPGERNRYEIIGVIEKGKIKYIDRKLKVYKNIRDLVEDRYDTRVKFIKRMDEQHIKKILQKKMTFDEARKITEEDYIQYTQCCAWDTAGIMQRFLKEFTTQIPLTEPKKEKLKTAIMDGLKQTPWFKEKKYPMRIPFFDKNIFPLLLDFTTKEELKNYLEYRRIRNWLIKKAYEKLSMEGNVQ